jgi:Zn-dependent protease with chaperone function
MAQKDIPVSPRFKKMAVNAIFSIVLFVLVYIIFFALALGLTILCGRAGLNIITTRPGIYTAIVGVGLIAIGAFVLFFLVKFLFTKNAADRSHLVEITREQQPRLFNFVEEIVREVQTNSPKKIYLSADVNASVFYDSGFWSMFFPIKKNLQIGLGLVNTVSENEFRAILAHEFGHFSQRSMKVGSYVYNVNKVVYNMLFENSSYQKMVQGWANIDGIFSIFIWVVVKMVQGIQWVLRKVYAVVNLSYMGLSREMEFHADEVAANVAGSAPLINSLRRMDLADHSYNTVLNYYGEKIAASIKTDNIYPQQHFIMHYLARENKVPVENELPMVDETHLNRYNKSKLVIKDQWASHPSTNERVEALHKLNIPVPDRNARTAFGLFDNMEALQKTLTDKLFSAVQYAQIPSVYGNEEFSKEQIKRFADAAFHPLFNNYYDNRNPVNTENGTVQTGKPDGVSDAGNLYSNAATDLVYGSISLENDIQTLKQIQEAPTQIKSFDYDGKKHTPKNCAALIPVLETRLEQLRQELVENDRNVYRYFTAVAAEQGKENELQRQFDAFFAMDKDYDRFIIPYSQMANGVAFVQHRLPVETIENNVRELKGMELGFKKHIGELMAHPVFQKEITPEVSEQLNGYLQKDLVYFNRPEYFNNELETLYAAINQYQAILSAAFINTKREMLHFMAGLEEIKAKRD